MGWSRQGLRSFNRPYTVSVSSWACDAESRLTASTHQSEIQSLGIHRLAWFWIVVVGRGTRRTLLALRCVIMYKRFSPLRRVCFPEEDDLVHMSSDSSHEMFSLPVPLTRGCIDDQL